MKLSHLFGKMIAMHFLSNSSLTKLYEDIRLVSSLTCSLSHPMVNQSIADRLLAAEDELAQYGFVKPVQEADSVTVEEKAAEADSTSTSTHDERELEQNNKAEDASEDEDVDTTFVRSSPEAEREQEEENEEHEEGQQNVTLSTNESDSVTSPITTYLSTCFRSILHHPVSVYP